ncbi:MAG: hypothetical protein GY842_22435 [bacterium]|nr:hypothetical protein [bacterium]
MRGWKQAAAEGVPPVRRHVICCRLTVWVMLACSTSVDGGPPSGHGAHPPMPDQQYILQCRLDVGGAPRILDTTVQLRSPALPAELKQKVELPAPVPPLQLTQYLPQAVQKQDVLPTEDAEGQPAVELSIVGPTQSYRRWLISGDQQRNRLTSLIGTWRYMAVADRAERDELFAQFESEFTREPKLRITRMDGSGARELSGLPGAAQHLKELGCNVRITSFFAHFAMDESAKQPVNRSDRRLNPAAKVEIESAGKKEIRWVFAKFAGFDMQEGDSLPFQMTLNCPLERENPAPDFVLITVDRRRHEVWVRHDGKVVVRPLALDDKIKVGSSQYVFDVARFVPSGRLTEEYVPASGRGGSPALQFETKEASGKRIRMWLGLNQSRVIATPVGPMTVVFTANRAASQGVHP